jgi:hypothetical protein
MTKYTTLIDTLSNLHYRSTNEDDDITVTFLQSVRTLTILAMRKVS